MTLLAIAQKAAEARGTLDRRKWLKKALLAIWRELPLEDRRAFYDRCEAGRLNFMPFYDKRGDAAVDNALSHLGAMIEAHEGRDADFLKSLKRQARRQAWKPSPKQRDYLMRLFLDWKGSIEEMTEDLIDDEDTGQLIDEGEERENPAA